MPGKRSFAPKYGRRVRRRVTPVRRKAGYRKYIRKAATTTTSRPQRLNYSRRAVSLNNMVANSIRGMAETKIIPLRNTAWSQPDTTATGVGIAQVKFVCGATPIATGYTNYTPVGGFAAPQGDGKNNRDGQFIYLKGTSVALTVNMDHVPEPTGISSCISFRVICFKAKRALAPTGQTLNPDTNMFLTNGGANFGDASPAPGNMDSNDILTQPINTNNFAVISDRKFTLSHTTDQEAVQKYPSFKLLRYNLNHSVKARIPLNSTDEPVDYNYRFGFAIYAYYPQQLAVSAADTPLSWSAGIRGTTSFCDV